MAIHENKTDIETDGPGILEYPKTRGDFIVQFYFILSLPVLFAMFLYLPMSKINPVREFMRTADGSHVLCATTAITFICNKFYDWYIISSVKLGRKSGCTLILLIMFWKRHPYNFVLLLLYTLASSFTVAGLCSQIDGEIVSKAMFLAIIPLHSLAYFAKVTAKEGRDLICTRPFLLCALLLLIILSLVTTIFPGGVIVNNVYNFLVLALYIPILIDCCLNLGIDLYVTE
ncbi:hypothetical protein CASFOL_012849 [Castilleja foliolosa]|uniref:Uncharacterized protein n=1 Tax=Castilleja foliolosa TaxID=1961234 RepID=A0ABD3DLS4_9LAMI